MENIDAWKAKMEQDRIEKNEFLGANWQSPISMLNRRKFKGLNYFSPDQNYTFELELHEHTEQKTIEVKDSKGNIRKYLDWGEFRFEINGEQCTIQAYKIDPAEERLFIPFKDATSGKETYGAGRYLELDAEENFSNGKWTLDLNNAYNPWCAYSHDYACPLVPPENWLKVSILAGEKNYTE